MGNDLEGMVDVLGDYTYHTKDACDAGEEPPSEVTDFVGRERQ